MPRLPQCIWLTRHLVWGLVLVLLDAGCMVYPRPGDDAVLNGSIPYIVNSAGNISIKVQARFNLVLYNGISRDAAVTNNYFEPFISSFEWRLPTDDPKAIWNYRDITGFGLLVSRSKLRYSDDANDALTKPPPPLPGDYLRWFVSNYSNSPTPRKEWDDGVNAEALLLLQTLSLDLGNIGGQQFAQPASGGTLRPPWEASDFRRVYRSLVDDNRVDRILTWGPLPTIPRQNGRVLTGQSRNLDTTQPKSYLTHTTHGFVFPADMSQENAGTVRNATAGITSRYVPVNAEIEIPITLNGKEIYVPVWYTVSDLQAAKCVNVLELKRSLEEVQCNTVASSGTAPGSQSYPWPTWGSNLVIWFRYAPLPTAPVIYVTDENFKAGVVLATGDHLTAESGATDGR